MERVSTITYKGKSITVLDLTFCQPEDTLLAIPLAKMAIAKHAPKSALVITDVKGAKYNKVVADTLKEFTAHNTPYVKASAVVGAEGAALILLQTLIFITRRELRAFATREEALEWLVNS